MERENKLTSLKKLGIEIKEEYTIPPEISDWLETYEKEPVLTKPITDENGQVILTAPQLKPTGIKPPLSRQEMALGLRANFNEAIRWLTEWWKKIVKITIYRQNQPE